MEDLKNKLLEIVKTRLISATISSEIALNSIIEFYDQHKIKLPEDFPDYDMLLFQYGTYNYPHAQGPIFELDFTRQIADPEDDEFFQINLTLYYNPGDIGDIEDFNLWSIDKPTISDWRTTITATEGFKRAAKATPLGYKIDLGKT